MSTYDPLAAVQDESVGAASSGVVISSQGLAIESGILPPMSYAKPQVSVSASGFQVPPWMLLLGVGVGAFLLTTALYPKDSGDDES